jgi:MFS family permease
MPGTKVGVEEVPLLTTDGEPKKDAELDDDSDAIPDNPEDDKILFGDGQRHGTSLLINDSIILILETLQFFALLQSLSFRWAWPLDWLRNFSFVFAFNLDIWEMVKISTNGTYKSVKFYNTPSADVPIEYWHMVLMWFLIFALGGIAFVAAYITMTKKKSSYLLIQIAKLQQVYMVAIQVTAIPVGVLVGKLFHCADDGMVDVSNDIYCYQGAHWAYLAPCILFLLAFYILFPVWLIKTTNKETLDLKSDKHENYLQLKETEYIQGMDMIYIVANFHVFSSFQKKGMHYRAALHIMKFVVIIFYALLFQYVGVQAMLLTLIFFFMVLSFTILRPFRVRIFNTMLILNYFMLCANALIGSLIASFNSYNVQSVWFTPNYSYYVLIFIQGLWVLLTLIFLFYITLRHFMLCVCVKRPLWPSITSKGLDNISITTKKYIRGILRARLVLGE